MKDLKLGLKDAYRRYTSSLQMLVFVSFVLQPYLTPFKYRRVWAYSVYNEVVHILEPFPISDAITVTVFEALEALLNVLLQC